MNAAPDRAGRKEAGAGARAGADAARPDARAAGGLEAAGPAACGRGGEGAEAARAGNAGAAGVPLVRLEGVSKSFGSNPVLDAVDFDLRAGEIHALCGENGAGKSTLLGLLYGLHQPSRGTIWRDGTPLRIESPSHAQMLGISCVFQELSLAGALSVGENIYAGRAPSRAGIVDWTELHRRASALLHEFGLDIDVTCPVDSLPVSSRQIVEIAKALSLDSRILLLDEPTSALAPDEVDALFAVLRTLTGKGIGIVYVSHHMTEIFKVADRITVLRDGRRTGTWQASHTSRERVVAEMIGGMHPGDITKPADAGAQEVLQVSQLTLHPAFEDISFAVRAGEIVGLAGLMGARRSEIVRAIAGLMPGAHGTVRLNGARVRFDSLRAAMRAGIGFVPEERKSEGLFLDRALGDNLVAASLSAHAMMGVMRAKSVKQASLEAIRAFDIRTPSPDAMTGTLSGGNQQKIMLAKWLKRAPDLLIVEEPTKGVDVGARFRIHSELQRCAGAGMAMIVVSSDFSELLSLCNCILVIHEGRLMGALDAGEASEAALLEMAAGHSAPGAQASAVQAGALS